MTACYGLWRRSGTLGVNRAAEQFGVPRTTLKDRISGRVEHGCKSGPVPYLNKEEEQLVNFLIQLAKIGHGKTKQPVGNLTTLLPTSVSPIHDKISTCHSYTSQTSDSLTKSLATKHKKSLLSHFTVS